MPYVSTTAEGVVATPAATLGYCIKLARASRPNSFLSRDEKAMRMESAKASYTHLIDTVG